MHQLLQIGAERLRQRGVAQGVFDVRLQIFQLIAGIVALAPEFAAEQPALACELLQRVGKIHLTLGRRRRAADDVVDVGIDDVAADDGVVGKFVFDGGLFHDLFDLIAALAHLFRLDVGVL